MKQILLLTKNVFIDTELANKIQQLGYEVFCSSQLLESILLRNDYTIFNFFKMVIFSESVTNSEFVKIFDNISSRRIANFRVRIQDEKTINDLTIDAEDGYKVNFINPSMNLSEIREILVETKNNIERSFPHSIQSSFSNNVPAQAIPTFISELSKKEKALLDILYEQGGNFIHRNELSSLLWGKEASNSTLTQLSQIVGRLKKKMKKNGLNENLIETHWNMGYALSSQLCESIAIYLEENMAETLILS